MFKGFKYLLTFCLVGFYSLMINAQDNKPVRDLLTKAIWAAPNWDSHIDADSFYIRTITKSTDDFQPQSLRFLSSGKLEIKRIDKGYCGMGLLSINKDSSYYILNGNILVLRVKGEYIGEESFDFKKGFELDIKNKNKIQLYCIDQQFGDMCIHQKSKLEYNDDAPPPPHSLKKQL